MKEKTTKLDEWRSDFHLTFYRILLLTIIVAMPSIVVLYQIIGLEGGTMPQYRVAAVLIAALILLGSYRSEALRQRLEYVMYAVFFLLTAATIQVCQVHHFKSPLGIGLIVVVALCGLGFQKPPYLRLYHSFCIVHLLLIWRFGNIPVETLMMLLFGVAILMIVMNFFLSDRNQLLQTLVERTHDANKASELKSQFLATMSHEMRTPLNAILGMLRLTLEDGQLDSRVQSNLETAQNSSKILRSVIDEILDFSKIEAGELEVKRKPFNPSELCNRVTELFGPAFDESGVTLISKVSPKVPRQIFSDRQRVFQIVCNLLDNAQKFTPQGGQVILRLGISSGDTGTPCIAYEVHDSGIGISEEDVKTIFLPFRQVDSSYSRPFGGTGLGLPISKQLAALIGGELTVKSTPGMGATFTLLLPFDTVTETLQKDDAIPKDVAVSKGEENPTGNRAKQNTTASLYILVAEDNTVNQKLMASVLSRVGHRVSLANNGAQALERFKEEKFDVVLMDVQMPVVDGLEAARQIREFEANSESHSRTPIIAITAHAFAGDKEQCLAAGMDAYISKPLDFDEFYETLHGVVAQVD